MITIISLAEMLDSWRVVDVDGESWTYLCISVWCVGGNPVSASTNAAMSASVIDGGRSAEKKFEL